ncbi:hypothetical protein PAPHI01_2429 [Pancytospora philotis]|nr:hypothetical protein PAPHI01_2429 [Pancytospora philotis]
MATMINIVKPFKGLPDEDAHSWLQSFILRADANNIPPEQRVKIFICCLQESALTWAADLIESNPEITSKELTDAFVARFSGQMSTEKAFERLITSSIVLSQQELLIIIKDTNMLAQLGYVNLSALKYLIARRMPVQFGPAIRQAVRGTKTWQEFLKVVESDMLASLPLSPPINKVEFDLSQTDVDYIKNMQNKTKTVKPNKRDNSKWCPVHRTRSHSGDECWSIIRLKQQGYVLKKESPTIGQVDVSTQPVSNDVIKPSSIYRLSHPSSPSNRKPLNPFKQDGLLQGKRVPILVDTGADTSIICQKFLSNPEAINIQKTDIKAKSACGNDLTIIGTSCNVPITINTKAYNISSLISESKPDRVIIGADAIIKHPELLEGSLTKKTPVQLSIQAVSQVNIDLCLQSLLTKMDSLFQTQITQNVKCTLGQHRINVGDARPISAGNSRIPVAYEQALDNEIKKNLELGIIAPSSSSWSSRIVPVPKKDGSLRMCIDYRPLNKVTIKDQYPIPRIDEILDALSGAAVFSTLDATSGYYQVELAQEDRCKTAFSWKYGLYEFNRMPFGLCNAPATFQRIMNQAFQNDRAFVLPYFDDIIIFSKTPEEHIEHLEIVLARLKGINMALNRKKCMFLKPEVKILGFVISKDSVRPDPEKIVAIQNYKRPENLSELRSFLGLVNYNREFIPKFTQLTLPLYAMLKGEPKKSTQKVDWTEESAEAFKAVKAAMKESTFLAMPNFSRDFIVITDASHVAIGGLLVQKDENGHERVIHTFSRVLDKAQKNYATTDLELLAIVKTLDYFRHYLLGRRFTLRTDHRALVFLQDCKNPSGRQLRYASLLQHFSYDIEHIKGVDNPADSISRYVGVIQSDDNESCLSVTQRNAILDDYHMALGHGSSAAMKYLIQQKYKWPGMYHDIDNHVSRCIPCLCGGYENKKLGNRSILPAGPNELWEVDIIGYLEETKHGNKFIFVAIDHYTKWVEAAPIKTKDKESIARLVQQLIIDKHGSPQRILTDNGLEFDNNVLANVLNIHGIQHDFCSPGHHETVGAVERVNQTLFNKIKKLCNFGHKSWDLYVKAAAKGVNLSFNRAIGTCPAILKYGILPNLTIDAVHGKLDLGVDLEKVTRNLRQHGDHYRESHIQKGKIPQASLIQIGDQVLIFKQQLGKKLANNWIRGFKVVGLVEPDAFIVENSTGQYRINRHHIKKDSSQEGGVSSDI